MNAKTCKALRKLAAAEAWRAPSFDWVERRKYQTPNLVRREGSARRLYQEAKKAVRLGRIEIHCLTFGAGDRRHIAVRV